MLIPGIPGVADPSFRTRDRRFLSLDSLVWELRGRLLDELGLEMDPRVAKAVVQVARRVVCRRQGLDRRGLAEGVSRELRSHGVLVVARIADQVLAAYARLVIEIDIAEVFEEAG